MIYCQPQTIKDALRAVSASSGTAQFLAGGTDLMPRWSRGIEPRPDHIVDLKHIASMNGITNGNGSIRIGACTPLSDIASSPLVRNAAPVLALAAGRIACPQVRNRGTIGGNLCNASPAADTAIPLILLDAVVAVASTNGRETAQREIPITEFFRGPGATVLGRTEILTHVQFAVPDEGLFASWEKFGTRPSMEIAVASVGVALLLEADIVRIARVAYGSVAPIPLRGSLAEETLVGHAISSDDVIGQCEAAARSEICPISDVRATDEYRREIVAVLLKRMLRRARRCGKS